MEHTSNAVNDATIERSNCVDYRLLFFFRRVSPDELVLDIDKNWTHGCERDQGEERGPQRCTAKLALYQVTVASLDLVLSTRHNTRRFREHIIVNSK